VKNGTIRTTETALSILARVTDKVGGVAMRRKSKTTTISALRGVLRHLHDMGQVPQDLSTAIEGPAIYVLKDRYPIVRCPSFNTSARQVSKPFDHSLTSDPSISCPKRGKSKPRFQQKLQIIITTL
jgi:hypothetical protein